MIVGRLKIEAINKIKNNPFYGDYEVKTEHTQTIVYEKYVGLESPKYGIVIKFKSIDCDNLTFTIGKYYFTGEPVEAECDMFSCSFTYDGHVYEVTVDYNGQLTSLDEWYNTGDFEDGEEPDNHYTKKSKDVKWELLEE